MSLLRYRALIVAQGFVILGFAAWSVRELQNNAFLRAYLEQAGWMIYALGGITGTALVASGSIVAALFPWGRVKISIRVYPANAAVDQSVRLTNRGQAFVAHDDDGPEAHAEPGNLKLPTTGAALAKDFSAPRTNAPDPQVQSAFNSLQGSGDTDIVIPTDSPLRAYVLKQEGNYRVVEPQPGEPTMQRLRGVVVRRKDTDDKRTNDSSPNV